MKIDRQSLKQAADEGLISAEQADSLWSFFVERGHDTASFRFTHVLYYFGGLLAIGAMTLFMTLGWELFGGWGLFGLALLYGAIGIGLTEYFLRQPDLSIPAGIMATFVVALTPLAIYGLQVALGFWPEGRVYRDYHVWIDWRWIFMELGTLAAGAILLYRYRLPFMMMPLAVTLWYMSMDLVPFLVGAGEATWELRRLVSLYFGLLMLVLAVWIDIRTRLTKDYAYWLYIFGVITFWGGLSLSDSSTELGRFIYFLINVVMILIGAMLNRRVFAVCGALGVAGYLSHLSYGLFANSRLFPFVLTFIGLGIIYAGVLWQRHEVHLGRRLRSLLPLPVRQLVESRQD